MAETATYKPMARYDALRQQFLQQSNAQKQEEEDAIKRRYAAMGALNSGAYVKSTQMQQEAAAQRQEQGLNQIGFAEQAEQEQRDEAERQRAFAREERVGSQQFAGEQAQAGRQFQTQERLGSQEYGSGEALKQRAFASSEREASQTFGSNEAELQRKFASGERVETQRFQDAQRSFIEKFQTGERISAQDYDTIKLGNIQRFTEDQARLERAHAKALQDSQLAQQQGQFDVSAKYQRDALDIEAEIKRASVDLAKKQFAVDAYTNAVNAATTAMELYDKGGDPYVSSWSTMINGPKEFFAKYKNIINNGL